MNDKSVVATGRGSSEVLKIMENDLRAPAASSSAVGNVVLLSVELM